jgi:hypothetical protein
MAFLRDADAGYLRDEFAQALTRPVRIRLFTEPVSPLYVPGRAVCETCPGTQALLEEVAALSEQIYLEVIDVAAFPDAAREAGVTLLPTIAVDAGADAGVRFVGLPDGHEFSSLVETLVSAGSEPGHGLEPETVLRLSSLTEDVEIKTFVTPT